MDHPYKEYRSRKKLYTLPYISNSYHKRIHGKELLRSSLEKILKEFNIVGFAVSWPLESHGHPGFECGQTLHVLDYLVDNKNGSTYIQPNRPLALLDKRVITNQPINEKPTDAFGRSLAFCLDSKRDTIKHLNNRYSSKERKRENSGQECASLVLEQFLAQNYNSSSFESKESSDLSHPSAQNYFIDDYENERDNLLLL